MTASSQPASEGRHVLCELDAAERVEPERMEEPDRLGVPPDRTHADLPKAPLAHGRDHGFGEEPADPAPAMLLGHDDRLELRLVPVEQEPGEPHDLSVELGDPDPLGDGEMRVERETGIVAADRRIVVELAVRLRELPPEPAAGVEVGVLVRSDRGLVRHG
jgi:hypothetical protein